MDSTDKTKHTVKHHKAPEPEAHSAQPVQPVVPPQPVMAHQPPQPVYAPQQPHNPGEGLGIAGLVSAFFFAPLGIILSAIGLSQSKKVGLKNGVALAGLITSIVFTVFELIVGIIMFSAMIFLVGRCQDLGVGVHESDGTRIVCR